MHVYVENVSLSHLLMEQRLIEEAKLGQDRFGGKGFIVTDGTACTFSDIYRFLTVNTGGKTTFQIVPPFPMLLLAYALEFYIVNRYRLTSMLPFLKSIVPALGSDITNLQPSMFQTSSIHLIFDDSLARKPPSEGGLGYKPPYTTLMGLAKTVDGIWSEMQSKGHIDTYPKANLSSAEHAVGEIGSKVGVLNIA